MNVDAIVTELKAERERLDRAIEAIKGIGRDGASRPVIPHRQAKRVVLSAAARKRIGMAKKKWWAERKKHASK